jgi:hypothetical protein
VLLAGRFYGNLADLLRSPLAVEQKVSFTQTALHDVCGAARGCGLLHPKVGPDVDPPTRPAPGLKSF